MKSWWYSFINVYFTEKDCTSFSAAPSARSHSPGGVEDEEGQVEVGLLWVVLDGEEARVEEHEPAQAAQHHQPVAGRRLVQVQDLAGVEPVPVLGGAEGAAAPGPAVEGAPPRPPFVSRAS